MRLATLCSALLLGAAPVCAETPRIATDILPVQSLVAMVTGDLAEPEVVVAPGASPHSFALRPSQARALEQAQLVVWVGPELTPWLEKPVTTLATGAQDLRLLHVPGIETLAFRDILAGEEEDDHDDHGEEGHDDHDHVGHDDHDHEAHEGHEHHHHVGDTDPHAWLDPRNAAVWVGAIAEALAGIDPEHAETYRANAEAAAAELTALDARLAEQLAGAADARFISFHDGFQYFEHRYGLTSVGTVALGDASDPSPARIAELRERVAATGASCAFREPQYNDRLLQTVSEGQSLGFAVLDPLGSELTPGATLYPDLLEAMATAVAACAK
ncbi:zinc ABC transporter substrate-binding protein [Albibacillus kandeliae]|uniref:zinc ABC transporter substrate-binding protein n=1 Tax=Albibacillus kandeliae TaxID=2174228 RepID=UPI000D698ADC|nr:zinc ABC transporter substrate-binding protein [Albibacillus kandeliae]